MPKISEEELQKNLCFTCPRCTTDCVKVSAVEPELGYVSKVDGSFVGPLCDTCWKEIPEKERAIKKIPETAFTIVVQPDGGGAYITTDGIELSYIREPSNYDVISACSKVVKDIEEALFSQKLVANLVKTIASSQKASNLVIPRR